MSEKNNEQPRNYLPGDDPKRGYLPNTSINRSYMPRASVGFDDAANAHKSLVESLEKKPAKKKKIKLSDGGKKLIASLILAAAIPTSIYGLYNSSWAKRNRKLKEAHNYVDEVIIAQILDEQGYKPVNEKLEVKVTKSKEEVEMLVREIQSVMHVDRDTAYYIVFSYYNFDKEVFNNLGYANADEWAKAHDYKNPGDSMDSLVYSAADSFENMAEEEFLEAYDEYVIAAEKIGNVDIHDVSNEVSGNESR